MPIAIACKFCDWKGKVRDELAGKNGKCPTCGEVVPIPNTPSKVPPPIGAKKSALSDDEPDIVDDAEFIEEDDRPKPKPRPSAGRSVGSALNSVGKGRRDEDEDDDRPRNRKRRDDDEDGPPARSRKRRDEDYDEPPARSKRRRDEDEEDEKPSKSRRRAMDDDDDEPSARSRKRRDNDEPRRPKRKRKRQESRNTKRVGAVVGGVICLVLGIALIAFQYFVLERIRIYSFIVIILAIIGIFQGLTGIGLGGSEDDGDDGDE